MAINVSWKILEPSVPLRRHLVMATKSPTKSLNLKTRGKPMEQEPPSPMAHAGILARHAYKLPPLEDETPRNQARVHTKKPQQLALQREGSSNRKFFGKFGFFGRRSSREEDEDERQRSAQRVVQQTQTSVDVQPGNKTRSPSHNAKVMSSNFSSYSTPTRPPVGSPLLPARDPSDSRITLVLDLDETLVRSSFDCTFEFDFEAPFALNGCWCTARVRKRPFVDDFLQRVSQNFELVLMTAGVEPYASLVLDILDDRRTLEYRFYRDSCTKTDTGLLVKDLSRFNRDLQRTIIVDNSPNAYLWHPQNAVDVDDFVGDSRDRQLCTVADFLEVIKDAKDIRPHLSHWRKGKNYANIYNNSASGPAPDRRPNGVCQKDFNSSWAARNSPTAASTRR